MNKVELIGRLTKDIEIRVTRDTQLSVGRFTLAVNRRKKDDGADFINCTVFGKTADVMEKYVKKGHQVAVCGRIQTGSYEKDGVKHYTTDVIVEDFDFLQSKQDQDAQETQATDDDGFMNLPDDVNDEGLPF